MWLAWKFCKRSVGASVVLFDFYSKGGVSSAHSG